jgi:hypothetical protein
VNEPYSGLVRGFVVKSVVLTMLVSNATSVDILNWLWLLQVLCALKCEKWRLGLSSEAELELVLASNVVLDHDEPLHPPTTQPIRDIY